ncbi:MAG: translation initiation factor IF-2 [Methanopyri archaeon]|nr:translation initiation factor IF-2 [Methanopyri archaeon]
MSEDDGKRIRQPIIAVLGHVDHGKTTLLDKIRGTAVAAKEAGGITQHIGASEIPIDVIEEICGPLLETLDVEITIPGLLFIDTPGHAAFTNLRRRGGALADIAILVVDIMEGVKPQTEEALNILRRYKTPFVVAANKIDRIPGWKPQEGAPFLESLQKQDPEVQRRLDEKIYELVGQLHRHGFQAERFDRVQDFTRTVAIVPTSGITGEGIPELLMVVTGLAQRFLEDQLRIEVEGPGKAAILEVKEEPGLGNTLDVILYDGILRKGDTIVVGHPEEPIVTRIRSLLKPKPLDEMRDPTDKFRPVEEVSAAAGVKISAPNLENAIAGAPVRAVWDEEELDEVIKEVIEEVEEVTIETDKEGIIIKADTLGTLEAVVGEFKEKDVPIRKADVGDITKKDVIEAAAVAEKEPLLGVIVGFNVGITDEAKELAEKYDVDVILGDVIYELVEEYEELVEKRKEKERRKILEKLVHPGKIKVLPGYIFRQSKPAIVGVKVLGGTIRPGYPLMREDGRQIGKIKQIQMHGEPLEEARKGQEVAISIEGCIAGRHFEEGDVLYTDVPSEHARKMFEEFWDLLTEDEREVLEEIAEIKRKEDPFYGMG